MERFTTPENLRISTAASMAIYGSQLMSAEKELTRSCCVLIFRFRLLFRMAHSFGLYYAKHFFRRFESIPLNIVRSLNVVSDMPPGTPMFKEVTEHEGG